MVARAAAVWIAAAIVMSALWMWQRRLRNATLLDAGWALLVAALAVVYAMTGDGAWTRRSAIAWMMGSWGARLGVYLLWDRVLSGREDPRYQTVRARWGAHADARFFWLSQIHALGALFFALPSLIASANPAPMLSPLELLAATLWVVGFAGESTADRQLLRFKKNPANVERTCRAGLWRYSRHPNYFFESVMWLAYGLFAAASPTGWVAMACTVAMLYFLLNVTGIPPAEAQALRSRGDDYREYQRTTSAFVPWFRRG